MRWLRWRKGKGRRASPVFRSKRDVRYTLLVLVVAVSGLVVGARTLFTAPAPVNLMGLPVTASALAVWWLFRSVRYKIGTTDLFVVFGPFHWLVPLEGIESVERMRNAAWMPATSTDRLRIRYRLNGRVHFLLISPKKRDQFLKALVDRVPALKEAG